MRTGKSALIRAVQLPINLSKCLNVASLAGTGVNFIGIRFNIVRRDGAPYRALDSLARLRIGRKLGCVNFKLDYEAMKRRPSIT